MQFAVFGAEELLCGLRQFGFQIVIGKCPVTGFVVYFARLRCGTEPLQQPSFILFQFAPLLHVLCTVRVFQQSAVLPLFLRREQRLILAPQLQPQIFGNQLPGLGRR